MRVVLALSYVGIICDGCYDATVRSSDFFGCLVMMWIFIEPGLRAKIGGVCRTLSWSPKGSGGGNGGRSEYYLIVQQVVVTPSGSGCC